MPTLLRLLLVIGAVVALAWGAMVAMATLKPQPREITHDVTLPSRR